MEVMRTPKILASLLMVFTLSGCGYDGHYRYPCQDPVNWESEECKPPICTANGACPEDLVKIDEDTNNG
jgi:predicted small lipoprotein YifL